MHNKTKNDAVTSGKTTALWLNNIDLPHFPALTDDSVTDVCIVGAGITGLTTAYTLLNAGKKVIILEDGAIASGESGRTTAHLAFAIDDHYSVLEHIHSQEKVKLAADSHRAAVDYIEQIIKQENIACDFMRLDGYLFPAKRTDIKLLTNEYAAAKRAGIDNVYMCEQTPIYGFEHEPCLCFPQQAQFHPLKYLAQLANIIVKKGGYLFTHTRVQQIKGGNTVRIKTQSGHEVTASAAVIATNAPINDKILLHSKLTPYRTYVIAAIIPKGYVKPSLFWDTCNPYHYIRVHAGDITDTLIVGGNDHQTGKNPVSERPFDELIQWAKRHFPDLGEITYRWSGQILEPIDYLAYIGHHPYDEKNVYIATGDSGNGMTHGTIAGLLLTDLITGRANPWENLYKPSRLALKTIPQYITHVCNIMSQYLDYLKPSKTKSTRDISLGEGAIISQGKHKVAAYRDQQGKLYQCSAICPHLGGVVHWNCVEKTWDCPVHGSRFSPMGEPLNGPACHPLSKINHPS